jgi:hypothetical protein
VTAALDGPRKAPVTLVFFSFDRGDGTEELFYADVQADYTDEDGQVWTAVPTMAVRLPSYQGGLEQGPVSIDLPVSLELADLLSNGQPFPPVRVIVRQDVAQFANDPEGTGDTTRLVLYRGRVHRAIRNKNGSKGLVQIDVTGSKGKLAAPCGLQVNPTCVWALASATARSNPASLSSLAAYWTFNAAHRTTPGGSEVVFADQIGSLDLENNVGGAWSSGFVGEDDPGKFEEGAGLSSDSGLHVPVTGTAFAFPGNFSISFWWMSAAAGNAARHAGVVTKAYYDSFFGPGGNCGWAIVVPAGTRDLRFYCSAVTLDAPGAVPHDGQYHHYVVRRSGSSWSLWVDGVQVDSATSAAAISFADAPGGTSTIFMVGDHNTGSTHARWPGHYEDLGIFEGRALSPVEIAAIWAGGIGRPLIGAPSGIGCAVDPTSHTLAGAGSPTNLVQSRAVAAIAGTVVTLTGLTAPGSAGNGNIYEMGYLKLGDLRMDIRAWDRATPTVVHLRERPPAWWLGETVEVHPGCDGQHATCRDRWNHEENFGGFGIRMPNYSTHEVTDA